MAYIVNSYNINYDGGLTSSVMLRKLPVDPERGFLFWTSYHRNNAPSTLGPGNDSSWTELRRFVIPGGVGNNEIVTLYYKEIIVGAEPASYTLFRSGGSGNESTVASITRVVGATGVNYVAAAHNFGNTSDNIAVPPGGLAYYSWGSALGGGLQTPTPPGLTQTVPPISHPVGAHMHAYYQTGVTQTGNYTGSFQSGADHNATITSAWQFQGEIIRLVSRWATASNTVTVSLPPIEG